MVRSKVNLFFINVAKEKMNKKLFLGLILSLFLSLALASATDKIIKVNVTGTESNPQLFNYSIQSDLNLQYYDNTGQKLYIIFEPDVPNAEIVINETTLRVWKNTIFMTNMSNPNAGEYGIKIIGNATNFSDNTRDGWEMFRIQGLTEYDRVYNVTFKDLDIYSNYIVKNRQNRAFAIQDVGTNVSSGERINNGVTIDHLRFRGFKTGPIEIYYSNGIIIKNSDMLMNVRTENATLYDGKPIIYVLQSGYIDIINNTLNAMDYYNTGPPIGINDTANCQVQRDRLGHTIEPCWENDGLAPASDTIAFYGSKYVIIEDNTITGTNAALIYFARPGLINRTTSPWNWRNQNNVFKNNIMSYSRQSGFDLDVGDNTTIIGNRIFHISAVGISFADTDGGLVSGNYVYDTGEYPNYLFTGTKIFGSLGFSWHSRNITITGNDLFGPSNQYAIAFRGNMTGYAGELFGPSETNIVECDNYLTIGINGTIGEEAEAIGLNTFSVMCVELPYCTGEDWCPYQVYPSCTTGQSASYQLIMIASSLMIIIFIIGYIYNKGLQELDYRDLIMIFISISISISMWIASGQIISSLC